MGARFMWGKRGEGAIMCVSLEHALMRDDPLGKEKRNCQGDGLLLPLTGTCALAKVRDSHE